MPPKSLLLLLSISFFLIIAPLAKADSIANLAASDSGQLFTLWGTDYRSTFVLTPNSILSPLRPSAGSLFGFACTTPVGWAGGDVLFKFSFGNLTGEFNFNVGSCPPNVPCFGFELGTGDVGPLAPASVTLTFEGAHGGTGTVDFFVSDVTPEPSTFFLLGTGVVLLGAKYCSRVRSAGRSSKNLLVAAQSV